MRNPSERRFLKWEQRLVHLSQRKHGLPQELLEWTAEYFGKAPKIQSMLGFQEALKPETSTAIDVMERLKKKGVYVKQLRNAR